VGRGTWDVGRGTWVGGPGSAGSGQRRGGVNRWPGRMRSGSGPTRSRLARCQRGHSAAISAAEAPRPEVSRGDVPQRVVAADHDVLDHRRPGARRGRHQPDRAAVVAGTWWCGAVGGPPAQLVGRPVQPGKPGCRRGCGRDTGGGGHGRGDGGGGHGRGRSRGADGRTGEARPQGQRRQAADRRGPGCFVPVC
jgi:hypothetical protein